MKKVTKKVAAPKSKAKIVKKPLRKYEDGGMAGKGPLQPTPKKEKTAEELAKETVARLTTIPKVETPTPKATTPTKKRSDGFASEAQKTAYIKNTKELLKKNSVADLVKMKHGTAAGLAALGFKDEVKTNTSAKSTSNSKSLLDKKTFRLNSTDLPEKNALSGIARRARKDIAAGGGSGKTGNPLNMIMNTSAPLKNKTTSEDLKRTGSQQKSYGKYKKAQGKEIKEKVQNDLQWAKINKAYNENGIKPVDLIPVGAAVGAAGAVGKMAMKQLYKAGTKAAVKVASKGVENIVKNSVRTNTLKGAVNKGGKSILNKSTQAVKQAAKPSTVNKIKSGASNIVSKAKSTASKAKGKINDKYLDAIGQRKGGYGERGQYKRLKDLQAADKRRASYSGSN